MTELSQLSEKKRFKVFVDAFAVPKGYDSKVGKILDISRTGLSFNYLDDEQSSPETFKLDVLLRGHGPVLTGLLVKVISDVASERISAFSLTRMRRCDVKFMRLDQTQESCLEHFIMNNTVDGFQESRRGAMR